MLSHNRVRLGVGVGWCEEEYIQTGQDFHTRGKRLNDMIPALRALWKGGWVEYHGTHYDVPPCQMNPSPTQPVPILGGGDSEAAMVRATTLCDGWINTGAALPDRDAEFADDGGSAQTNQACDLHHQGESHIRSDSGRFADILVAPWMSVKAQEGDTPATLHARRVEVCEQFAAHYIGAMA